VVPLLVNFVMHDYGHGAAVFERWRQNVVNRFGPNSNVYPPLPINVFVSDHDDSDTDRADPTNQDNSRQAVTQIAKKRRIFAQSFACDATDCDASFDDKTSLRNHVRQHHTGERPYKCPHDDCEWAFVNVSLLRRHLKTATHTRR